jgi:WD40 repeat protein
MNEDDLEIIKNLNKNHKIEKTYENEYNLEFILPGHMGRILDILYLRKQNILVSSGDDSVIKFWNMAEGISIYHFNLDSAIDMLIFPEIRRMENLFLLNFQNHLVKIDITNEPYNFTTNFFKYNRINNFKDFSSNQIFLLSKNGSVLIFDNLMKFKQEIIIDESSSSGILFLEKWGDYFLIFREDKKILLVEFKDNKSKILFKIELQYDITTCCFLNKNILLFGTRDFKIVLLNVKREYELFLNRQNMVEEEKLSTTFNVYVNNKLAKMKNRMKSGKNIKKRDQSAKIDSKLNSGKNMKSFELTKNNFRSKSIMNGNNPQLINKKKETGPLPIINKKKK